MRKILLNVAITLDGFIEGPAGEFDWCLTDQEYGMTEFLARTDLILFGRKSYEVLKQWEPNAWPGHSRVVVSETIAKPDDAVVIRGDLRDNIIRIKQEAGKDIWLFGGASLSKALFELGLIDELHLSIHPLLLGRGKPLFEISERRTNLQLKDTKTYSSGLVQVVYELG